MGRKSQKRKKTRAKVRALQHKISVFSICFIILMLAGTLLVGSISLREKNEEYKAQEAQLQELLEAEEARAEEIDELEEYVGTDAYIEDVAKEKLGLVNPNEILFKEKR